MRYLLTLTVAEMMKILKCHSQYRNRRCHKFQLGPGSINRTLLQFPNFSRFPYFPGKWSLDKIKKTNDCVYFRIGSTLCMRAACLGSKVKFVRSVLGTVWISVAYLCSCDVVELK